MLTPLDEVPLQSTDDIAAKVGLLLNPAFVNGCDDLLIETPAGLLDNADAEARIRAETEEETGFRIGPVERVFEATMSPGSVTERLYFFVAPYTPADRVSAGGGDAGATGAAASAAATAAGAAPSAGAGMRSVWPTRNSEGLAEPL